jgi:hypothetical protein
MIKMLNSMIKKFENNNEENHMNEELYLVKVMNSVKCTILESGLRPTEMKYYFCSCDPNKIEAICEDCARNCHREHIISPQYFKGVQVCSCGTKAHNVEAKNYEIYKQECYYHELSINSGLNVYFNNGDINLCLFCYNVCFENQRGSFVQEIGLVPHCNCKHQNHGDVRFMYSVTNEIGNSKRFSFNGLNSNQIINLIFKCKESFHNIYSQFEAYHMELSNNFSNHEFVIDKKIHLTNFYSSLVNFSSLCEYFGYLRYPTKEVMDYFNYDLLIYMFKRYEDSEHILTLLYPVVHLFNKITLSGYTNHIPKFKASDLENMSILQRLTLINNKPDNEFIKNYLTPGNNNLIDLFINNIELITKNVKTNKTTIYDVLYNIISILSRLAAMNFFTKEQMIKLCSRLSNCFKIFSSIRKRKLRDEEKKRELNKKESKLFLKILKILRIFCLTYNDTIIKTTLASSKKIPKVDNINFLHGKSDIGKLVSRISISILNVISKEYDNADVNISIYKEIINRGSEILSSITMDKDVYLASLKKIYYNKDVYLKLLFGGLIDEEKRIINKLKLVTEKVEACYQKFYDFNVCDSDLNFTIIDSIQSFFEIVHEGTASSGTNNFDLNKTRNTYTYLNIDGPGLLDKEREGRDSVVNRDPGAKYQNILYGSRFLFTIIKSLKVTTSIIGDSMMESIYKFLWFYISNNPENAVIGLSSHILRPLTSLPDKYASSNFLFFLQCFKIITNHNYEIGNGLYILKTLTNYLINLKDDYSDKYSCLFNYLKIVDIIFRIIPSYNFNVIILYAHEFISIIHNKFTIFKEYSDYLQTIADEDIDINSNKNKNFETSNCKINNTLAFDIFYSFLKILNITYDTSKSAEKDLLKNFFSYEKMTKIIKNLSLNIDLRTEILKFLRKCYIDISADDNKTIQYLQAFLINMNHHEKVKIYNPQIYFFLKNILKRSESLNLKKNIYDLLIFELKNFKNIIGSNKFSAESELNYFESGIIIPCKTFLNKIFSIVDNHMSGEEFLYIYEMTLLLVHVNLVFTSKNMFKDRRENLSYRDMESRNNEDKLKYRKTKTSIIENKMLSNSIGELDAIYKKMKSYKFQPFNYKNLYEILDTYIFNCLQRPNSEEYLDHFAEPNSKDLLRGLHILKEGHPTITNNLNALTIIYQLTKGNLECSSLMNNLPEICLEEEKSYGNLLLRFLIFSISNEDCRKQLIMTTNTILFKLLICKTSEIQAEILNILANPETGDYNIDFLQSLAMILFRKLVQIFIANFNYNHIDNLFNSDYYIALNIIKILKYLCEEHNQLFQGFMINRMSFYFSHLNQHISFYELLLFIVNKILLLSKWEYSTPDKEEDVHIDYFYDLFSASIELLIEIIQGNKKENLDQLIIEKDEKEDINEENNRNDGKDKLDFTINELDDEQILNELNDFNNKRRTSIFIKEDKPVEQGGFQVLIHNMKRLLFHDGSSSEIIYKVRTELMNFLIAILEEKNTHESLKNFVIDSFDVGKILGSIGSTMKKYFLKDTEKKAEHKLFRKRFLRTENEENSKKLNRKLYRLFSFDNHIYKFYVDEYYIKTNESEDMFPNSVEFEISNTYYRFIKIVSLQFNHEAAVSIIERVKTVDEDKVNKSFKNKYRNISNKPISLIEENEGFVDEVFIEYYYIIKFFEDITQFVEVQMPDYSLSTVIFTVMPTIKQLSAESKDEFLEFVDRENQYTKLEALIKNVNYFCEEIDYNCKRKRGRFMELLRNLNYYRIQVFVFVLGLLANLVMLVVLQGDTQVYNWHDDNAQLYMEIHEEGYHDNVTQKVLEHNNSTKIYDIPAFEERRHIISELVAHSEDTWGVYYRSITLAMIALAFIFIVSWIIAKLPLYYRIAKKKYMNKFNIKSAKILTYWDKAYIIVFWTIIGKDHINSLIWMFVVGVISVAVEIAGCFYPFLLLSIMNLDMTLKNIIKAIKLKYKELLFTFIYCFLIIWAITTLGFFFLHEDFDSTIDEVNILLTPGT